MDVLGTFVWNQSQHHVRSLQVRENVVFVASDVASVLGLHSVHSSVIEFDEDEKTTAKIQTQGGEQTVTVLTEIGVYRLIMRSNKEIARPFQKWVCKVICNIREQGEYVLREEVEALRTRHEELKLQHKALSDDQILLQEYKGGIEMSMHDRLVEAHAKEDLVYIGKIRREGDSTLIKIGSTDNLQTRVSAHKSAFGSFTVLHVFPCTRYREFENMLHHNEYTAPFRHEVQLATGGMTRETYMLTTDGLSRVVNVARRHVRNYRGVDLIVKQLREDVNMMRTEMTEELQALGRSMYGASALNNTIHPQEQMAKKPYEQRTNSMVADQLDAVSKELLNRASMILKNPLSNIFDVVCALSFVTGLGLTEIFKSSLVRVETFTGKLSQLYKQGGTTEGSFEVKLLLPFELIDRNMQRIHDEKPCENLTPKEINSKWCNSVTSAGKKFIGSSGLKAIREAYRSIIEPTAKSHGLTGKRKIYELD
jgi:prophage antirepressor-like protein